MAKFFVFISLLLITTLLDCGLCIQNVTCNRRWNDFSNAVKKTCFFKEFPVRDPRQEPIYFQLDYSNPMDIEWVEFTINVIIIGSSGFRNAMVVEYIPRDIFTTFPNLTKFIMGTNIRELYPGDFNNTTWLKELRLNNNNIQIIRNGVFSPLPENMLNDRDIPGNPLPLKRLKELYLDNNDISEIEPNSFYSLISLTKINLKDNRLIVINEQTFAGLVNLRVLDLSSNKLTQLFDGTFDKLSALRYLHLNENKLKLLSENLFEGLLNLERLQLTNNNLEHIGQSLYHIPSLIDIRLKANHIEDVDLVAFAHMQRLKVLDLSENGLTFATVDIKEEEQYNSSLGLLYIGKNNFTSALELNKLRMFPNVTILDLEGSPFKDLEVGGNNTLKDILPSLSSLYIDNIDLTCEYYAEIHKKYKSLNVWISSRFQKKCTRESELT